MKRQADRPVDTSVDTSTDESVKQWQMEIGGRIKHARQSLGLTQDAFATEAGAKSKSGLQDNERGRSMPGGHIIGALAKRRVNTNWIFTGDGEMMVPVVNYQVGRNATPLRAAEAGAPRNAEFDPLLLQSVIDFLLRWIDDHQVVIAKDKYGAVISVLYRVAAARGCVEIHELEQVLRLVA